MAENILVVIDGFTPGGAEEMLRLLMHEWVGAGHRVKLLILRSTLNDLELSISGVEVVKFSSLGLLDVAHFLRMQLEVWSLKPKWIFCNFYWSQIWGALLFRPKRSRLVWVEHNTYHYRSRLQWKVMQLLARNVNVVICPTQEVSDFSSVRIGKACTVIPDCINPPNPPADRNFDVWKVVIVARLVPQKNIEMALQAFKLAINNPEVLVPMKMEIVGDGILRKSLEMCAIEMGLENDVTFHGFLPIGRIHELLAKSHILLSTSLIEGFSLIRIEACGNGNCVVTTQTGGVYETLVDDEGKELEGVFICETEPTAIAAALLNCTDSHHWSQEAIENRRGISARFTADSIASRWLDFSLDN